MIKSYGKVIIQKDSILYHTSDELFDLKNKNDKSMLFCTFHPSEWDPTDEYVTFIKLKKDVSLLFMIDEFKKAKIISCLNLFTNDLNLNLAKKYNDFRYRENPILWNECVIKYNNRLFCYVNELIKENLDGWMSSIENKTTIEVSLINDSNIFEPIKTEKLKRNWRNGFFKDYEKNLKVWGKKYEICTIEKPVILYLNDRFRIMIEEYKKYEIKTGYLKNFIFQVLLDNATIYYHKGDLEKIVWNVNL